MHHVRIEAGALRRNKVAEYSYRPGLANPHAIITGDTAHFAHRDAVGNVIALTDSAQSMKRTYEWGAWGVSIGGTDYKPFGNADRARFKGALWLGPQVDLYYMRARWYEPKSGRFLSEDPIGLAGGINPYAYANGDPVNARDPTGLRTVCEVSIRYWKDTGQIISVTVLRCWNESDNIDTEGGNGGDGSCEYHDAGMAGGFANCPPPRPRDIGEQAELKCAKAAFWVVVNAGMDFSGARAAYSLFRGGARGLRLVGGWIWDRYPEAVTLGAGVGVAEAAHKGQLDNQDAMVAGGYGFLGYVGTYIPAVSTGLSYAEARDACNPD